MVFSYSQDHWSLSNEKMFPRQLALFTICALFTAYNSRLGVSFEFWLLLLSEQCQVGRKEIP
jgi:hypothetical protein